MKKQKEKTVSFGQAIDDMFKAQQWFEDSNYKCIYKGAAKKRLTVNSAEIAAYEIGGYRNEKLQLYRDSVHFGALSALNNTRNKKDEKIIEEMLGNLDKTVKIKEPSFKQTIQNLKEGKIKRIMYSLSF